MKYIFFLLISLLLLSCNFHVPDTKKVICNFFDTNFHYECSDSAMGKVQLNPLNYHLDTELMIFKFIIPDSLKYAKFYKAYTGRIMDIYFKSVNTSEKERRDSLLFSKKCDVQEVKERIERHYCKDPIFRGVFETALESFYYKTDNNSKKSRYHKIIIPIDTLIKISLLQFDIVSYDSIRGFGYHFVCGVNPYNYSIKNKVNLLVPGFCQEALRNKNMLDAHSMIIDELKVQLKKENPQMRENSKRLCNKYQDELRERLIKEGTLRKSLLHYYEINKDIEPFVLVDI